MKLAVLGATGFIGRAVVEQALLAGHEVRALVRDASTLATHDRLEVIEGDARDPGAVQRTLVGADVVISALGTRRADKAGPDFLAAVMGVIISAMETQGVRRIVAISGAGISLPGERKPLPHRLISALVGVLARDAVAAKQREYQVLSSSDVDWTAVRPTRVVDGPSMDNPRIGISAAGIGMRVTRGDLARFIVSEAEQGAYIRRAPFISS